MRCLLVTGALLAVCVSAAPGQDKAQAWLRPFLDSVPADACAVAALDMTPAAFVDALAGTLMAGEREVLDAAVARTETYQGLADIVARVRPVLMDRVAVVMRAKAKAPDPQVRVEVPGPLPEIAVVFWLRAGADDKPVRELITTLTRYRDMFGFQAAFDIKAGGGWEPLRDFTHPRIPGTGELLMGITKKRFVIANSTRLCRHMGEPPGGRSLGRDVAAAAARDPERGRGTVLVQAQPLQRVIADVGKHVDKSSATGAELLHRIDTLRRLIDAIGEARLSLSFELRSFDRLIAVLAGRD